MLPVECECDNAYHTTFMVGTRYDKRSNLFGHCETELAKTKAEQSALTVAFWGDLIHKKLHVSYAMDLSPESGSAWIFAQSAIACHLLSQVRSAATDRAWEDSVLTAGVFVIDIVGGDIWIVTVDDGGAAVVTAPSDDGAEKIKIVGFHLELPLVAWETFSSSAGFSADSLCAVVLTARVNDCAVGHTCAGADAGKWSGHAKVWTARTAASDWSTCRQGLRCQTTCQRLALNGRWMRG